MFRVHEEFLDHPKLDTLDEDPERWSRVISVWFAAGLDCRKRLTDGRISRSRLSRITPLKAEAVAVGELLVELRLWELDGATGFRFHDWGDVQETKDEVQERRLRDKLRQRSHRQKLRGDGLTKPPETLTSAASQRDSASDIPRDSDRESQRDSTRDSRRESGRSPGWLDGRERERSSGSASSPADPEPVAEDLEGLGRGMRDGLGLRVVRAFMESPLVNIATGFSYSRWHKDWDEMAQHPEAQLAVVMQTLIRNPHWLKRWQSLNPGHFCKYWTTYAAGQLPAYSANIDARTNTNGRARSFGMSEVPAPEEYVNQEDDDHE